MDAYELTYRHHYEMQDDWLVAIADPEIACFTYSRNKLAPADDVAARPNEYLPFELFKRAMLRVADGDYFKSQVRDLNGDGNMVTTWIWCWRRRPGCSAVKGVDDNPWFHKVVRRDNWRDVWEAVVGIARDASLGIMLDDEYIPRESQLGAVLALAGRLAKQLVLVVPDKSYSGYPGRWWSPVAWIVGPRHRRYAVGREHRGAVWTQVEHVQRRLPAVKLPSAASISHMDGHSSHESLK
nr:hypothetical protein [Candidatus Sigynarchaeum springense]